MKRQRREQNARGLKPQARQIHVRLVMLLLYRHALHRVDDVAAAVALHLHVAPGIARVVLRRASAVLRVLLVAAVLCPAAYVVEVLAMRVDELDGRAVAIDVDNRPQWTTRLNAREENALLVTVDPKVNVTRRRDVVEKDSVALGKTLGQSFCPVAGLVGEIGTGVARQAVAQVDWIVAGETEAYYAAPIVGDLEEFDAYLQKSNDLR